MNLVRKEHGPDAVILSNRRIEEGIEIVAAANYDESAVQRALEASRRDVAPPPAPKPRTAADAVIAAVTRRRSSTPAPEPVAATTSAVAALARAAVGATGRTLDSADEIVPTRGSTGFAATLARAAVNESTLPEQIFAPFADAIVAPSPAAAAPVNRARFQIDPPLEESTQLPAVSPPPLPVARQATVAPEDDAAHAPVAMQPTEAAPAPLPALAPAPALTLVADDAEIRHLRQEVAGMRQVIEREMNRFTDERLRGCPVRATALDLMDEYGFDAGIARDVAMQIPLETEAHRGRGLMLGLISRKLPIAPVDPMEEGGVIALVGPTGAGKTTTIAKLASRFAEAHAARDVALVTTDTMRIGAREQLYGYGRQLGIAVHEANSGTDLDQLLERLKDYKLVLIDTAGLQGLVLSKLDETGRFGNALSVAVDHKLPITWVTDGQDVPDDLHRASAANLVLRLEDLRRAADMPCNPELNHAVA
jgi:flagellar biosynthesis protein FlhF